MHDLSPEAVSCDNERNWAQGRQLVNTLGAMEFRGLSGLIRFDENRSRTDFKLDIVQILSQGYQEVSRVMVDLRLYCSTF